MTSLAPEAVTGDVVITNAERLRHRAKAIVEEFADRYSGLAGQPSGWCDNPDGLCFRAPTTQCSTRIKINLPKSHIDCRIVIRTLKELRSRIGGQSHVGRRRERATEDQRCSQQCEKQWGRARVRKRMSNHPKRTQLNAIQRRIRFLASCKRGSSPLASQHSPLFSLWVPSLNLFWLTCLSASRSDVLSG